MNDIEYLEFLIQVSEQKHSNAVSMLQASERSKAPYYIINNFKAQIKIYSTTLAYYKNKLLILKN